MCGCVTVENLAFLNYIFKCGKVICCSNIIPRVFVQTDVPHCLNVSSVHNFALKSANRIFVL